MEKPSASKNAAPAEKKAEPKGEAKPAAKAPAQKAGGMGMGGGGGAMGSAPQGAGAGMPAAPDPMADLKAMMSKAVGGMQRELEMVQQKLGGSKVQVELDAGDIVIPAAFVGKIPPALRQQFETCVGCSANELVASKRGQSMQGQQKVSKGPNPKGGGMQGDPGSRTKPAGDKPSAMKSASTSSASRA